MDVKRIIVLANSYKKTGRCIAGREIDSAGVVGRWLRPVSHMPEGELHPHHTKTTDGASLTPLDIVDVPVVSWAADQIHPEDWRIDMGPLWARRGIFPSRRLPALEETPRDLWGRGPRPDRAAPDFLLRDPAHQSLYLVRPRDFRVEMTHAANPFDQRPQQKRRAFFSYAGRPYALGFTDPVFSSRYAAAFPAPDQPAIVIRPPYGDRCLLCVSLTPLFNGYHYKVVATVLELP